MGHGQMTSRLKIARFIMILFNVIFFLIGATLIGEGFDLLITHRFEYFTESMPIIHNSMIEHKIIICMCMIIPGICLLCLGFFGCSGALTQIECLLFAYSWILGIVLICQTIMILLFVLFRSKIQNELVFRMHLFIQENYQGPLDQSPSMISVLIDIIMSDFKCCGIESPDDFLVSTKWNRTNPWSSSSQLFQYPLSCCPRNQTDPLSLDRTIACATQGIHLYKTNCLTRFTHLYSSYKTIFFSVFILIILIELFGFIFVLLIHHRTRHHHHNRAYDLIEQSPPAYSHHFFT